MEIPKHAERVAQLRRVLPDIAPSDRDAAAYSANFLLCADAVLAIAGALLAAEPEEFDGTYPLVQQALDSEPQLRERLGHARVFFAVSCR